MISAQQKRELQTRLIRSSKDEKRSKGAPLSLSAQRIMQLIVLQFYPEMLIFAKSLARDFYDPEDTVQDAFVDFMYGGKWQSYNPEHASETGYSGWYRVIYKNAIRDAHRRKMRYILRHESIDGNWWEENDEDEYW